MTTRDTLKQDPEINLRWAAGVSGVGLLLMAVLAPIAVFSIIQDIWVPGEASTTVSNLMASSDLFRIGIFLLFVVAVLDILVAWGLYVVLQSVNRSLSLLAAWFRLVYSAVLVVALGHLLGALQIVEGVGFGEEQLNTLVDNALQDFQSLWDLGLGIFALHLIVLGGLVYRARFFPKLLGVLVSIAGVGYLVDSGAQLLVENYDISVAAFTFVGEPLLIIWLFLRCIKGVDISGLRS